MIPDHPLSLQYLSNIQEIMTAAFTEQIDIIQQAAARITTSLLNGGILHVFGSGHSHILAEELYVRAGGLAPVHAMLIPELMLHEDVERASLLERQPEYADVVLKDSRWISGDVLVVISNSGTNGLPVEVALRGRHAGLFVIALTSVGFSKTLDPRHPGGKRLFEVADLVIDNYGIPGDACLEITGGQTGKIARSSPTSTVAGAALLEGLVAEVAGRLADAGIDPPLFVSGNFDNDIHPALQAAQKAGQRLSSHR